MAKKIEVEIDVTTNVEPSIAELKRLKKEIKETAAGSAEFALLQQQINDTEDAIKAARTGASNFTEVLGQLPGPIGAIGNKVSGTVNTLKQFGALKLTDLKASFVELGKDLGDAAKGLGKLTGITKVYTVLNGFLAKSFQAVGVAEGAAATGAKALSAALIATGIGALVVLLATAASALYEMATGEKAAARAAEQLNNALERQNFLLEANAADTDRKNKVELAKLKSQGASAKTIRETQFKQAEDLYKTAYQDELDAKKIYNDSFDKADKEGAKKLAENLTKREQATKDAYANAQIVGLNNKADELKEVDDKNKELAGKNKSAAEKSKAERQRELDEQKKLRSNALDEIKKGEEEAFKATLTERERAEYEVNQKYAKLISIATKFKQDTTILETGLQAELTTMREKFAVEDADKKKELDDQETERLKKKGEEERGIILLGLQSKLEALDREKEKSNSDFAEDLQRLAEQKNILNEQEITELKNTELTELQKTEIRKKYADARRGITNQEVATEKSAAQAKHDINMQYLDLVSQFGNLLSQIAGKNKALAISGIIITQASSIAKIVANTAAGIAALIPGLPVTAPAIIATKISAGLGIASTIAAAAKSIKEINATPGPTASGGGGGSAPAIPAYTGGPTGMQTPQIQGTQAATPGSQIAETLGAASGRPVRAYVVSGEIQSQAAFDRRTNRAATFGG